MKVLFCPLASHGFVYPMIGIAKALEGRGHLSAFATDMSFAEELTRHGCKRIPRSRSQDGPSFAVSNWSEAKWAAVQVEHVQHALDCFEPDLLVGLPLTLGALIAAERNRLPLALLGFCTYQWPASREALEGPRSELEKRLGWRLREWTGLYNAARQVVKAPPVLVDVFATPALGDLFLVRSIPGFGLGESDLPPQVVFAGDCLWEPEAEDPELDSWLARASESGGPIIYVQHGRFFTYRDFWSTFKQVATSRGYWVAVSTSRMDCEIGDLPPRCLARPFLPQGRVLRQAHALVSAGNTTAVLGAVTAGVPSLLIPGGGEQPDVAAWARQAGIAKVLSPPASVTSEGIWSSLREIFDEPSCRQQAQAMSSKFSHYKGLERAVFSLEQLWRRRAG